MRFVRLQGVLLSAFLATVAPSLPAQENRADDGLFARVQDNEHGEPRALQMAIVRYRAPDDDSVSVDLIGAVHIGDKSYYAELNSRFRDYDALLYELIAAPDTPVPASGDMTESFVSNTQMTMRSALGLAFQLEEIDYGAPNFVHADLSPDELRDQMQVRGESVYVYFWRLFYAGMREASRDPLGLRDLELLASMLSPGSESSVKVTMAYQLADFDRFSTVLDGDDGSALIASRNQRAIDVLTSELSGGAKRVGIFYGVAHMPDLERRLGEQLGLAPVGAEWVDAWQLEEPESVELP